MLALLAGVLAAGAQAANTLRDIQLTPNSGGGVDAAKLTPYRLNR